MAMLVFSLLIKTQNLLKSVACRKKTNFRFELITLELTKNKSFFKCNIFSVPQCYLTNCVSSLPSRMEKENSGL